MTMKHNRAGIDMFKANNVTVLDPFQLVRVFNIFFASFFYSPQVIVVSKTIQSDLLLFRFR